MTSPKTHLRTETATGTMTHPFDRPLSALFLTSTLAFLLPWALAGALVWPSPAWADDSASELCFDFAHPVQAPLQPAAAFAAAKPVDPDSDAVVSGLRTEGGGWATARGRLSAPIGSVLAVLRDHTTLKDPKDCDLRFEHEKRDGWLDFENVEVTLHPFPLVSVSWKEQWGFKITEGTETVPKKVVISYQKTEGTNHIRHFCGNIVLTARPSKKDTDIAIYEETDATRRTPEAIAKGHEGTLRTIRAKLADLQANKAAP
jgi:hypothetical protein